MVQAQAKQLLNQKNSREEHPLITATARVAAALERLEQGVDKLANSGTASREDSLSPESFQQENTELRQERDQLNQAISQLENQYGELHHVAGSIYNKLDDTIKRLGKIIGN